MELHHAPNLSPTQEASLRRAGVQTIGDLAREDPQQLALRSGLPEANVAAWIAWAQAQAHEAVSPTGATAGGDAASPRSRLEELKVLLLEKAQTARVTIGDTVYENVPVVAAKLRDAEERLARELKHNTVLLREKAETARVRIGETWHNDVPLFKEKLVEGTERAVQEVRVRVKEIREKKKDQ